MASAPCAILRSAAPPYHSISTFSDTLSMASQGRGRGGSAMATTSETRSAIDWDAVFAAVEEKEGALLERLRRIIRVDNSIPPGRNYDTLVALVEPEFRRYGFQTERVVIPEERW